MTELGVLQMGLQEAWRPALGLLVGLPLALLVLNEAVAALQRRGRPLAATSNAPAMD